MQLPTITLVPEGQWSERGQYDLLGFRRLTGPRALVTSEKARERESDERRTLSV